MNIQKVAEGTYAIDPVIFGIQEFTSVYLLIGDTLALIDSGSPKSAPLILNGIRALGYRPEDVSWIILSHIHFDHASGAGELLKFMPQARVYVHYKGYNHILDPSRLTASAKRVFGDMIDKWYGGFTPVPKEKAISGNDGEIINLGRNRKLKVLATSGHAKHGICLYDPTIGGLFTGDEAGVYFPSGPAIIPTSPPPDFDPDHNLKTIKKLQDLKPKMLLFAHYSVTKAVDKTLKIYMDTLISWKEAVKEGIQKGFNFDEIVKVLKSHATKTLDCIKDREDLFSWIMSYHIPMCAEGYIYYLKNKIKSV